MNRIGFSTVHSNGHYNLKYDEKFNNIENFKTEIGKKYAKKTIEAIEKDNNYIFLLQNSLSFNDLSNRRSLPERARELTSSYLLLTIIDREISALEKAAKKNMHWYGSSSTERAKIHTIQQEINELMPSYERLSLCKKYMGELKYMILHAGKSRRKVKNTKNRRTKYRRAIIN